MSCKECTERHLGCHSTCEEYKKRREEWDKRVEWNRKQSVGKAYVFTRETKIWGIKKKRRSKV